MSQKPTAGRPLSRVDAARNGPRVPVFAVAAGALALVLVIAPRGHRGRPGRRRLGLGRTRSSSAVAGDVAFGEVTVEGEALPPYEQGATDPAVGQPAPVLTGIGPDGEPVTIDPAADGPMVIAFLAHWCPHCQAEVPRIVDLADDQGEIDGVKVVAVATSSTPDRPNFPPGDWLASEDWPGPVMVDSEPEADQLPTAAAAYGEAGFPFLVAIDAEGDVVARASGEQGEDGLRDFVADRRRDVLSARGRRGRPAPLLAEVGAGHQVGHRHLGRGVGGAGHEQLGAVPPLLLEGGGLQALARRARRTRARARRRRRSGAGGRSTRRPARSPGRGRRGRRRCRRSRSSAG